MTTKQRKRRLVIAISVIVSGYIACFWLAFIANSAVDSQPLGTAIFFAILSYGTILIGHVARFCFVGSGRQRGKCAECGYDFSDDTTSNCPKCGTARLCHACSYDLRGTLAAGNTQCPECGSPLVSVSASSPADVQ